jgi:hypothetical protein
MPRNGDVPLSRLISFLIDFLKDVGATHRDAAATIRRGGERTLRILVVLAVWWRDIHPKRIEAIGYLILLTAGLWEALTLRYANEVVSELILNNLDVQLKLILDALGSENAHFYLQEHRAEYLDPTNIIPNLNQIKRWNSVDFYSNVRLALLITGSFLIVFAKWREGHRQ